MKDFGFRVSGLGFRAAGLQGLGLEGVGFHTFSF